MSNEDSQASATAVPDSMTANVISITEQQHEGDTVSAVSASGDTQHGTSSGLTAAQLITATGAHNLTLPQYAQVVSIMWYSSSLNLGFQQCWILKL